MLVSRCGRNISRLCKLTRELSIFAPTCAPRGSMGHTAGHTLPEHVTIRPLVAREQEKKSLQPKPASVSLEPTGHQPDSSVSTIDLTSSRTISVKPLEEGSKEAKALYERLMESSSDVVLAIISDQHEEMNKVHYALAMKRLFRCSLKLSTDECVQLKESLKLDKGFNLLCSLVALKGPHYEAGVAADMLQFMLQLGLDVEHLAVKVFLQLTKYHLNDLDLTALVRLMYLLSRGPETQQTKVLQNGIRVLVNVRTNEIPTLNTWQTCHLLDECGSYLDEDVFDHLLSHLQENLDEVSVKLAPVILRALSNIDIKSFSESPLLDSVVGTITFCVQRITNSVRSTMDRKVIIEVLEALTKLGTYDVDLFNDIGARFTEDSMQNILTVLNLFIQHRFRHDELLLAFKKCLLNETINAFDRDETVSTVRILADTSRPMQTLHPEGRPESEQNMIENVGIKFLMLSNSLTPGELQQCSIDMAVLGKVNHLSATATSVTPSSQSLLQNIYKTALSGSLSTEAREKHVYRTKVIGSAIARAIGHSLSSIMPPDENPLVNIIDYILLVSADGLVHFDQELRTDGLPDGVCPVAVLIPPETCFHSNTFQLRGPTLLCGKLLQEMGYLVMMINAQEWGTMDERDRIPYLARRVNTILLDQDLQMM